MSLRDLMYPPITLARFQALREQEPKRICFGSIHVNALKDNPSGRSAGFFNVPFFESVGPLFPFDIFKNTKSQFGGYYRIVSDDDEFASIKRWIVANSDVVFIRSLFETAIAACEHYKDEGRSKVGDLEYRAKYEGNTDAKNALVDILTEIYQRMYVKHNIDAILSVPSSTAGNQSLPNYLAMHLAANVGVPDMTDQISWNGPKGSIKALAVEDKWAALEGVGLNVANSISGKTLLLIDDMYQSGATAHFVASRLRASGANALHLLAVSKGRRDTDNK